jgi:DNA adenine methylase
MMHNNEVIQSRIKNSQGLFRDNDLRYRVYPFVKWAGGKSQLLSELDTFIPSEFNLYFEPFLGGGALFFHLISTNNNIPFTAYLSDINEELINAYKVVKDQNNVEVLIELLKKHETEYKKNPSEYYYKLRTNRIESATANYDIERAARFITLNKTCYNGLYRVNKDGIFNVPIGRYKNPLICDSNNLRNVSRALRDSKAQIKVSNYKEMLLENAKEGDFIYLDPPYNPVSPTANFTGYTNSGFTDLDQKELANVFAKLNDRKCKILLSNSDTPFIRKLYYYDSDSDSSSKYNITEVDVLRAINSKGSKRTGHKELIISNYYHIS